MKQKIILRLIEESKKVFLSKERNVFTFSEICKIIDEHRTDWGISGNKTYRAVIADLSEHTPIKKWTLAFPKIKITKYTYGDFSDFVLLSNLNKNSYFCYYTGIYLHNLTEQIPKVFYVNVEQTPKAVNVDNLLVQDKIDLAFKNKPRTTNNIAEYRNHQIYLISGKASNNLGVMKLTKDNTTIKVTDLERTLLDAAVRPEYSGGIFEVMKAYEKAAEKISVNKLFEYLQKMNYLYPYHQCIGFYLERTNKFNDADLKLFLNKGIKYNFYLAHGFKKFDFSKKWKLYYPQGF